MLTSILLMFVALPGRLTLPTRYPGLANFLLRMRASRGAEMFRVYSPPTPPFSPHWILRPGFLISEGPIDLPSRLTKTPDSWRIDAFFEASDQSFSPDLIVRFYKSSAKVDLMIDSKTGRLAFADAPFEGSQSGGYSPVFSPTPSNAAFGPFLDELKALLSKK